ncbi:MAG: ABC-F family ATP-binding cassette domain-containing protein [Vallitaleaceae bacterium]|jgi:ATP-binding cassette subfamily F protein 3|nr:ABC-F family ATP-binding cassette domain-containing protein [Vallitaleaceae bacterium]
MILSCSKICKSFGINQILDQINFHINDKEKVAIVGINGAGKSTLFKIITGIMESDSGKVHMLPQKRMAYLAQNEALDTSNTIYDEILSTKQNIIDIEAELTNLENQISLPNQPMDILARLNNQYTDLRHTYESLDGYSYKSYVKGILIGLGFLPDDFSKLINTLSGGQKTRLALAKLLIDQPDILLLDEPTNHLDIKSTEWLENYLSTYNGALLIISHDRYFLDKIITKVIEIENHTAQIYNGNYSFYIQNKNQTKEIMIKQYDKQQKEIKRQEGIVRELRSFKTDKFITRAKSREKALEKIPTVEKPHFLKDAIHIRLDPKHVSGNDVLHVADLTKSFGTLELFKQLSFDIKKGEKIALIGPNGVGKSTLFKILLDELMADAGSYRYGAKVYKGYYDQEQDQHNDNMTLLEDLQTCYPKLPEGEIRNVLAAFLLTGDDAYKLVSTLSGGERGRLSLVKLILSRANFLLLDEPTNHLDIVSKSILENALNQYSGTLFFISHDRYFINQVANRVLELLPSGLVNYSGNYNYYLEKRELPATNEDDAESIVEVSESKTKWLAKKAEATEEKKRQKELELVETRIFDIETELESIDQSLCEEAIYTDHIKATEFTNKKALLEEALEAAYEIWEHLS